MNVHSKTAGFVALSFLLVALALPEVSHALRSTKQESHTDPDYFGYQPKRVVLEVLAENFDERRRIEERLTKELEKRGIRVYLDDKLFPPTREWDAVQRREIYERYSIEATIVVGIGASSMQIVQTGSQSWGDATATSYGDTAFASGSSQTTAIFKRSSIASYSGVLVDLSKGRVAWTCDIYTKASGMYFVSDKGDAKAAVKGIIKGLVESGHIPKK